MIKPTLLNARGVALTVSLLLYLRVPAQAQVPAPEKPARPAARVLKAGIRLFEQPDAVASLELQFAPRWSLQVGGGFFAQPYTRSGQWFTNTAGQQQPETILGLTTHYHADAQLRHYFRTRKPRPALTGWYAAAAVQVAYVRTRENHEPTSTAGAFTTHTATTRLQPQLYLGRQWRLGQHLRLDTFVGTEVLRRLTMAGRGQYLPLNKGVGVQLGWQL